MEQMRVLVIDDLECNQESARATLGGHEVTVCGTVEEGMEALRNKDLEFDVLLTDLYMVLPGVTRGAGKKIFSGVNTFDYPSERTPKEVPIGLLFACLAVNRGIKYIGIVTDGDHHQERLISLMNSLLDAPIRKFEARTYEFVPEGEMWERDKKYPKHWGEVLEQVLAPPAPIWR
jgi:CheY-like chemotaxis protein